MTFTINAVFSASYLEVKINAYQMKGPHIRWTEIAAGFGASGRGMGANARDLHSEKSGVDLAACNSGESV